MPNTGARFSHVTDASDCCISDCNDVATPLKGKVVRVSMAALPYITTALLGITSHDCCFDTCSDGAASVHITASRGRCMINAWSCSCKALCARQNMDYVLSQSKPAMNGMGILQT